MRGTVLTIAFVMAIPYAAHAERADRKPNVIVIVGDDMGYADIGIQGCKDIPTPHIDSIAKNGIRCTSGYVSGPYCSPTRAGLLTGRYQTRFGHEFNPGPPAQPMNEDKGLSLKETTFANRMKSAGYQTGLVGKWHLGGAPELHPIKRGFDEYYGFLGGAHSYLRDQGLLRGTVPVKEPEYLTDAFGREAVAFIDRHKEKPFFLYLAFNAVHNPLESSQKYLDRFPAIKDKKRQTYAGMMSAMDDAIGSVLTKLKSTALEEQTLVFFISDNGGPPVNASNNGSLHGNKASTWEGGIRVPWLVQWKGHIPQGKVFDHPVIQLDILPTAMAATGIPITDKDQFDGVDLMPHFLGKTNTVPHEALFWRFGAQTAVRKGDWKLVQTRNSEGKKLFNLQEDLGETKDLTASHPEKVKELQSAWDAWNAKNVPATWGAPRQNRRRVD